MVGSHYHDSVLLWQSLTICVPANFQVKLLLLLWWTAFEDHCHNMLILIMFLFCDWWEAQITFSLRIQLVWEPSELSIPSNLQDKRATDAGRLKGKGKVCRLGKRVTRKNGVCDSDALADTTVVCFLFQEAKLLCLLATSSWNIWGMYFNKKQSKNPFKTKK